METVLSYLMVGVSLTSVAMAMDRLRQKGQNIKENRLLACFLLGSALWSACFGLIPVQTDVNIAYLLRCVGLAGIFAYSIFATLLVSHWNSGQSRLSLFVKWFPCSAIALYPFLIQKENVIFLQGFFGMSYVFKQGLWNTLYILYFVIILVNMLSLMFLMCRNNRRKWMRVMGISLLACEGFLIIGMVLDTIIPILGVKAFPGSTLTQYLGALCLFRTELYWQKNQVTFDNMSEFLYRSVESPVLIFDEERRLKVANKSAEDFFGFQVEENIVGLDRFFDVGERVWNRESLLVRLEAQCLVNQAYCRLEINKILDNFKEVLGYIIIVDDLTDKLEVIQELQEAKRRADLANNAKSSFLARMSHEIRTPLNSVLGMNEMIMREATSKEVKKYSHYIKQSGETLLGIINDILDLSKLEAGRLSIMEDEYSLPDMLQGIVNMMSLSSREKGLEVKVSLSEDLPAVVFGDELRIKQIVMNITNNAVKYTDSGWVKLEVSCKQLNEEQAQLFFYVEDTGRGMKEKDLETIFSPYTRFEEDKNLTIEGNGLGMTISKELVELMGGSISVESTYGSGTTVRVTIPLRVVQWKAENAGTGNSLKEGTKSFVAPDVRILVVDDVPSNLLVVQQLLKRTKMKVDLAKRGSDGLKMVAKKNYQLIFLDHMMPEMDGIETLKRIKELPDNPNKDVPVVVMTANAVTGSREKYLEAGFTDYIAKPVDHVSLEKMVLKYLPEELYTMVEIEE